MTRYKQGGLSALLATRSAPGTSRKIQGETLEKLKARLAQPKGFHSYREIQQWLEQSCQLTVECGTLYRVVRYKLKANPKVPRSRALSKIPRNSMPLQRESRLVAIAPDWGRLKERSYTFRLGSCVHLP